MTDPEPVDLMVRALAGLSAVTAADVGCGTGRYMVELMRRLGERLFVYFIDCNKDMLEQLRLDPSLLGITGFDILHSQAERLPLPDGSLDCILTFNAIHHFNLVRFFGEAGRTLRPRRPLVHLHPISRPERAGNLGSILSRFHREGDEAVR